MDYSYKEHADKITFKFNNYNIDVIKDKEIDVKDLIKDKERFQDLRMSLLTNADLTIVERK